MYPALLYIYYFHLQSMENEHARHNDQPHMLEGGCDEKGKMETLINNRL